MFRFVVDDETLTPVTGTDQTIIVQTTAFPAMTNQMTTEPDLTSGPDLTTGSSISLPELTTSEITTTGTTIISQTTYVEYTSSTTSSVMPTPASFTTRDILFDFSTTVVANTDSATTTVNEPDYQTRSFNEVETKPTGRNVIFKLIHLGPDDFKFRPSISKSTLKIETFFA